VTALSETLENGVVGLVASLIGTYVIATWKGAESMDTVLREKVAESERTIALMSPKPSQIEEDRVGLVRAAITAHGTNAARLLRRLRMLGTLTFGWDVVTVPIEGLDPTETQRLLPLLASAGIIEHERRQANPRHSKEGHFDRVLGQLQSHVIWRVRLSLEFAVDKVLSENTTSLVAVEYPDEKT